MNLLRYAEGRDDLIVFSRACGKDAGRWRAHARDTSIVSPAFRLSFAASRSPSSTFCGVVLGPCCSSETPCHPRTKLSTRDA